MVTLCGLFADRRDWVGTPGERTVAGVNENDNTTPVGTGDTSENPDTQAGVDSTDTGAQSSKLGGAAWRDILLYGLARLLLFIVLTVVIQLIAVLLGMGQSFPLAISALLALIVAFPLSMFVFKGLRVRVNTQIAVWDAGRQKHKQEMRAQLEDRLD